VSAGPASRPQRHRDRKRSRRVGSKVQRPALTATRGDAPKATRTARARAAIDEHVWEREMNRLRRISLLLSAALAAVVARMLIDGPNLLGDLTGALILVLLFCSLALTRQGRRL
jgi:hypothetical protein